MYVPDSRLRWNGVFIHNTNFFKSKIIPILFVALTMLIDVSSKSYIMDLTQIIGIVAGILTATSLIPQLIKILKEKKADDVSPLMLIILLAGLGLWATYGIMKTDWPIIVTNSFSFLLNTVVLILRFRYSKDKTVS